MAQYTIKYRCGHTDRHQLYGKVTDRQRRISRMEEDACADCRRRSHEVDNAAAADSNEHDGLLSLSGSEKQVAWAESIRQGKIVEAADLLAGILDMGRKQVAAGKVSQADYDVAAADYNSRFVQLRNVRAASWWIDHRSDDGKALLRAVGV